LNIFSGIAGSGVSAGRLHGRPETLGSDRLFDQAGASPEGCLLNIQVVPQDGTGLEPSTDLAVFSTAVEKRT
jgi:hypothetical protein